MPEPIVTLNEEFLKDDLRELVRKTVEDALNSLLEVADELEKSRLAEAAKVVRDGYAETLAYTRGSRGGTGAAYAPTTPSRGSTARFAGEPAWSAPSPTGTPPSCSSPRGSNTLRRANGARGATWT